MTDTLNAALGFNSDFVLILTKSTQPWLRAMQQIHDVVGQIRDLINESWKHSEIRKKPTSKQTGNPFLRMASALDVLGDTESVIEAYISTDKSESNMLTLQIYGVLQAMFVQQEALDSLSIALFAQGIKFKTSYPNLNDIRMKRNKAIGHPTQTNSNSHIFTSAFNARKSGEFTITEYHEDGSKTSTKVDVDSMIHVQSSDVLLILRNIKKRLLSEKKDHYMKYKATKLLQIFRDLAYPHEKLHMAVTDHATEDNRAFGLFGIEKYEDTFNKFLSALKERDSERYQNVYEAYKLLSFALEQLRGFCDEVNSEIRIGQPTAEIFAHYVTDQFEKLQAYAREIDIEYDSRVDIDGTDDDQIVQSLQFTAHITKSGNVKIDSLQDWETQVNSNYGLLADDPIERPEELPADERDDIE
jgi:hypothetical protein